MKKFYIVVLVVFFSVFSKSSYCIANNTITMQMAYKITGVEMTYENSRDIELPIISAEMTNFQKKRAFKSWLDINCPNADNDDKNELIEEINWNLVKENFPISFYIMAKKGYLDDLSYIFFKKEEKAYNLNEDYYSNCLSIINTVKRYPESFKDDRGYQYFILCAPCKKIQPEFYFLAENDYIKYFSISNLLLNADNKKFLSNAITIINAYEEDCANKCRENKLDELFWYMPPDLELSSTFWIAFKKGYFKYEAMSRMTKDDNLLQKGINILDLISNQQDLYLDDEIDSIAYSAKYNYSESAITALKKGYLVYEKLLEKSNIESEFYMKNAILILDKLHTYKNINFKSSFYQEIIVNVILDYDIKDISPAYWHAVENDYINARTKIITPALGEDDIYAAIDLFNFLNSKNSKRVLQLEEIQLYKLMKKDKFVTDTHIVEMLYSQNYRDELLKVYNTGSKIDFIDIYTKTIEAEQKSKQEEEKAKLRMRPVIILGRIVASPLVLLYSVTLMPFDTFLTGSAGIDWWAYFTGAENF